MTIVGHSLVGATLAILFAPAFKTGREKAFIIGVYIFVAYIPDLPVPGWGHWQYHISHSIIVNIILMTLIVMLFGYMQYRNKFIYFQVLIGAIIAWMSHFLLDSLYNHGNGIGIFWPLSDHKLALPVPWFATLQNTSSLLSYRNLKVFLIEFLFYFPVFLTFLFILKRVTKWRDES